MFVASLHAVLAHYAAIYGCRFGRPARQQAPTRASRDRARRDRHLHRIAPRRRIPFDIAFGVAFTTDYVSRGITNSNSEPAIQGYIEPSVELPNIGTAYVNMWSSNVDYGEGFEGAEIDVAAGIRPEFGPAVA